MMRATPIGTFRKLIYGLLALACLVIGIAGIILPIIPGILFLILAGIAAARLSPRMHRGLRRIPAYETSARATSRIARLSWLDKCRYGFWVSLRLGVNALRLGGRLIGKASRLFFPAHP